VERPRLGYLEDGEKDLQELKVKRWRQKVNNKEVLPPNMFYLFLE
jgi:hypothetical protein